MEKCVICGNLDNYKIILNKKQQKLIKCENCGLIKTYPVLDFNYNGASISFFAQNIPLFEIYAREILNIIFQHKQKGALLDVGCGIGVLLKEAKSLGFNTRGVEVSKTASSYGVENFSLDIINSDLIKSDLPKETFDVVVLNHVFEHIKEPVSLLNGIKRVLKPDGVVLFVVPNMESLSAKLFLRFMPLINLREHIWHFSKKTLARLLADNGFSIKKTIIKEPYQPYSKTIKGFIKKILTYPFYFVSDKLGLGRNLFIVAAKDEKQAAK